MAISSKLLHADERVVFSTRTHVKALLVPVIVLIAISAVAGFFATLPGRDTRGGELADRIERVERVLLQAVIWGVALLLVLWRVGLPFLRWLTSTYTITNRRLITRSGILTRKGHDIPLGRISDVAYEHGLIDRMFGCGTLVISDASERGRVALPDIPDVEQVHLKLSDLLFEGATTTSYPEARRFDDGT